jgi:putative ABC transport system ATP-binding protein
LSPGEYFVHESPLSVERVSVTYKTGATRVKAVDDVSLDFKPATLTTIIGPSGSGKTTLLSVLGCLVKPDDGEVRVDGVNVTQLGEHKMTDVRRERIGFIFQAFRLFHALTAFENIMLAADIDGGRTTKAMDSAKQLLEELAIAKKAHLKPDELSGGEKQRVAIARALLPGRGILLADEPTASLDREAAGRICRILRSLADEKRNTVVVVSHDVRWNEFSDNMVVLEDGRICKESSRWA